MVRGDSTASDDQVCDVAELTQCEHIQDAIFTCKFPGCTRQYASTDGEHTNWQSQAGAGWGMRGAHGEAGPEHPMPVHVAPSA